MTKRRKAKKMATQMAATPTLEGKDAQRLLDSLQVKPTAKSRENAKKLAQYFKGLEKRN